MEGMGGSGAAEILKEKRTEKWDEKRNGRERKQWRKRQGSVRKDEDVLRRNPFFLQYSFFKSNCQGVPFFSFPRNHFEKFF